MAQPRAALITPALVLVSVTLFLGAQVPNVFILASRYLGDRGYHQDEIGLVMGGFAIASLVMSPFVGWFCSRFGHGRVMAIGCLVAAAGAALFAISDEHVGFTIGRALQGLGFDVRHSPNVVRISYPDSVARLAPNSRVSLEDMDVGIRDCIVARLSCQVYEFHFAHQTQQRSGNFLLDFFNFRRSTTVSGWQFDALVVVKDATVLFTSHGGTPQTNRVERRTNPLGPLQSIGESSGGLLAP